MILSLAATITTYRSYSRLNLAFRLISANTIPHWSTLNILLSLCFPPGCSELSEQRNASRSSIAFHITILIFVYTALVTGSIGTNVSTNAYPLLAFSITVYSSLPIEPREDGEKIVDTHRIRSSETIELSTATVVSQGPDRRARRILPSLWALSALRACTYMSYSLFTREYTLEGFPESITF